jgi:hypothetical protein
MLGPIFLGIFVSQIFRYFGLGACARIRMEFGFLCVDFTVALGLIVGVIVCAMIGIARLLNAPTA